jgi:hypothetical protein
MFSEVICQRYNSAPPALGHGAATLRTGRLDHCGRPIASASSLQVAPYNATRMTDVNQSSRDAAAAELPAARAAESNSRDLKVAALPSRKLEVTP